MLPSPMKAMVVMVSSIRRSYRCALWTAGQPHERHHRNAEPAETEGRRADEEVAIAEQVQVDDRMLFAELPPGEVVAPMYERFTGGNKEMQAGFAAAHPVGRLAAAAEIARTILFMASDSASFMNGSVVAVDGGYTAQ